MREFTGKSARMAALIGVSIASLAISDAARAQADEPQDGIDNTIVVSASRRDTNLQDTPIAIAVTSGEALRESSVVSFQDFTTIEPSVVVNNQGIASNQFIIRGVLSDIGATTGLYLDEVPLLGGSAVEGAGDGRPGLRLHDVSRMEVLKGPQGTLFGSGSMAGTIRVITNKPDTSRFEGGGSASVGFIDGGDPLWQGDAYLNIPVSEQVALRAVVWGETGGGYIDQVVNSVSGPGSTFYENVNDREVWGARLTALFQFTPDLALTVMGVHQEVEAKGSQNWDQLVGPFTSTAPSLEYFTDNYDMITGTLDYSAPFGTFSLIGSYAYQEMANGEDSTPTGLGLAGAFNLLPFKSLLITSQDFEAYTGEARFASSFSGPFQIVVGAYYENTTTDGSTIAVRPDDASGAAACFSVAECEAKGLRPSGFSAPGVPAADLLYAVTNQRKIEQWALYGQGDLELAPGLTFSAGIRYFEANIQDFQTAVQDIAGPPDFVVPVPVPSWAANGLITTPYVTMNEEASENSPSYNFSVLYEASPDVSFFARAASGFRVGGNNNAAELAGQVNVTVPDSYESDSLWSYELGIKAYLANRQLYLDAAIYQMDWSNQPLAATDPTGAFEYLLNAGKSRIRGAELQLTYTSDFGLSIGGGLTYTDAKLVEDLAPDVQAAGTFGFAGDRIPRVPRWTGAATVRYETPVSAAADLYMQSNLTYRSSSTYSFNNLNAFNQPLDSSFLLGAQLGVKFDKFDASVFVRNLFNEAAVFGLDASPDGIRVYSAEPRTIGIKLSTSF